MRSMSRPSIVSVIAGGFSFKEVAHRKVPGYKIVVNDSAVHLNCPFDEIVSMDRLWTENRWDQLQLLRTRSWLRRSAVQNVEYETESWAHVFDCDHKSVEFSDQLGILNGTSSGTCAINRAYQLKPYKLFLFGFDMCRDAKGNAYWYPPYPWVSEKGGSTSNGKYKTWASEFNNIAIAFAQAGCEVINVSRYSAITSFRKASAVELGFGK